jgi:hypothetical protein
MIGAEFKRILRTSRSTKMANQTPTDSTVRRAAKRIGLIARKSRWRRHSIDNHGGFTLVDPANCVVAGGRFDLTNAEVLEFCLTRLRNDAQ